MMILNVSGRTDIVAFYSDWFMDRYKKGYIDVRNPFYPKNVSRIYIKDVDAILFCTKNPLPILKYIKEIEKPIIFHVTLTPYKKDIEPNVFAKGQIIEAIKKLSSLIGIDNLYIRYDPIFFNDKYTIDYHIKAFDNMCNLLDGYVKKIIISFIDDYKNVRNNRKILNIRPFKTSDFEQIGFNFSKSAKKHHMTIQTCAEEVRLLEYGFLHEDCLSQELAYRLTLKKYKKWRARGNKCQCIEMTDIGVYNSCKHFCKYCYANYDEKQVDYNFKNHHTTSSLLVGTLKEDDIIKIKK